MHKSQSLFYLTTALHVSGVTITHLQDHKTTVTTASGNRYTVINRVKFLEKLIVAESVKKFSAFCGTRKFISIFTKGDQWTLLQDR